ncbi:hypothetical protein BV20DRAFT_968424 [Pilatotrama ljubarskyi]|nr:hypothetical protein BV20DRAFT_968424 [Pilatotrama ljubarskyi]
MYARAIQTLTLLLLATLVSASPAPIDPLQANVIAENRNMGCSGPQGCAAANAAIDTATTSGAAPALGATSQMVVLSVAAAGSLSVLGLL